MSGNKRTAGASVALVTGAAGFCGRHLVAHLLAKGYRVAGLDRIETPLPDVGTYEGDLLDTGRVQTILSAVQPDVIFHLAALTDARLPYEDLHRVNALGTLSLLAAVRYACPEAVVLVTGTSAVYGRVAVEALPIGEDQPFQPSSAYAVSKIAQEMAAYQQFAEHGLRVVRTRTFNLTGPGQSPGFVTSAFARQIAEIEAGRREPVLHVGNLEAVRDLADVRDAVRAYRLLAEQGEPGAVYNVCSEQGTAVRRVLDTLLSLSTARDISVEPDPARFQPADVPIQIGTAARLRSRTGWVPGISLEQTLRDVLDDWRRRIREEP